MRMHGRLNAGRKEYDGETMVRLIGCGVLALTFASTGWAAEHYVEVWNPPEARKPAAHAPEVRTPATHTAPTRAPARARRSTRTPPESRGEAAQAPRRAGGESRFASPARGRDAGRSAPVAQPAPGRLTVMQPAAPDAPHALNYSNIPRQYTPDGNVLQVGTHGRAAEVTR